MIDLPVFDDSTKLKLTELYRLSVETHDAVIRIENAGLGNHEVLKRIEANTATVAQFFEQFENMAKLAAGKNQVPTSLVIALAAIFATYFISDNLRNSNVDVRIPWLGMEIVQHKGSHD